ncbi:MAG: hypothetical protein LWX51_06775 [Deltaproteobacteria bacterium]|nr:hypothetical protein [Deltaproteobacteria bacterium]
MQKNGSPQSRRVRGEKIFCLSGDDDKQKGLQPLRGKVAAGGNRKAHAMRFVAAGLTGLVQSLSPDWTKIRLSLRTLRLCGEIQLVRNMRLIFAHRGLI